jgi:probable rRNA maturation factor
MTTPILTAAVHIEHDGWRARNTDVVSTCQKAVSSAWISGRKALSADHPLFGMPDGPVEVSVVLSSDSVVHRLNLDHRGKDRPTNVLAFPGDLNGPAPGAEILIGDVILGLETIEHEAAESNKTLTDHMCHLVIHGVLHLLGYDHASENDAKEMERVEVDSMASLGLQDPYETGS